MSQSFGMDGLKRNKQGVLSATAAHADYFVSWFTCPLLMHNLNILEIYTLCVIQSVSHPPPSQYIYQVYTFKPNPKHPNPQNPPTPNHGCAQPRIRSFTSEPGWKERPHFSKRSQMVTPRLWQSNGFSRWPV